MLAGARSGGAVRAYQQLLAGRRLAQTPDDGPLVNALVKTVNLIKVADAGSLRVRRGVQPRRHPHRLRQ